MQAFLYEFFCFLVWVSIPLGEAITLGEQYNKQTQIPQVSVLTCQIQSSMFFSCAKCGAMSMKDILKTYLLPLFR